MSFGFSQKIAGKDQKTVKDLLRKAAKAKFSFRGRSPDLSLGLAPRMVLRDAEEAVFYLSPKTGNPTSEDVCLWTNCKAIVQAFTSIFEDSWGKSIDIVEKLGELPIEKGLGKTCVISDPELARRAYDVSLQTAKKEILIVASSKGLLESLETVPYLSHYASKGVKIRIMAPITSENLPVAQKLSDSCEVRHIPIGYLGTTIVDGTHLFQFRESISDKQDNQETNGFANTSTQMKLIMLKKP